MEKYSLLSKIQVSVSVLVSVKFQVSVSVELKFLVVVSVSVELKFLVSVSVGFLGIGTTLLLLKNPALHCIATLAI